MSAMQSRAQFVQRKQHILSSLAVDPADYTDKSPKGSVDLPIVPLIDAINQHQDYVTTSSCSGRSCIFRLDRTRSKGGEWLMVQHSLIDFHQHVQPTIRRFLLSPTEVKCNSEVTFRFEPFILHVECVSMEAATRLLSIALQARFADSGIMLGNSGRVLVNIRCAVRMEVPLVDGRGELLVDETFLHFLTDKANDKYRENDRRIQAFTKLVQDRLFSPAASSQCCAPEDVAALRSRQDALLGRLQALEGELPSDTAAPGAHATWCMVCPKRYVPDVRVFLLDEGWMLKSVRIRPVDNQCVALPLSPSAALHILRSRPPLPEGVSMDCVQLLSLLD